MDQRTECRHHPRFESDDRRHRWGSGHGTAPGPTNHPPTRPEDR